MGGETGRWEERQGDGRRVRRDREIRGETGRWEERQGDKRRDMEIRGETGR